MSNKDRHYFFLSPFKNSAFTRCPKCEARTKVKKYCLLIHINPHHLLSLNKTTKYCPRCDLIIAKKEELERLLCAICEERCPEIIGNEYFIFGTMERRYWEKGSRETMATTEAMKYVCPFKNIFSFKHSVPTGWIYKPDKRHRYTPY